jgi:hypothetical protein
MLDSVAARQTLLRFLASSVAVVTALYDADLHKSDVRRTQGAVGREAGSVSQAGEAAEDTKVRSTRIQDATTQAERTLKESRVPAQQAERRRNVVK